MHFGPVPTGDTTFEWVHTDKHKVFKRLEGVTPLRFYREHVSAKADQMVSIINDPRNPYHKYVACVPLRFTFVVLQYLFVLRVCNSVPLRYLPPMFE